jgi:EmrB/QacA subfamily drug resistance transporter
MSSPMTSLRDRARLEATAESQANRAAARIVPAHAAAGDRESVALAAERQARRAATAPTPVREAAVHAAAGDRRSVAQAAESQDRGTATTATPVRKAAAHEAAEAAARRGAKGNPAGEPGGLRGLALALILTASFMVVLDFSIVNVALPSIEAELGFSASAVQWIVTAYAISFGGLLILGGRAADLFGRRVMFITGLVVFSLASLAGGLAHDPVLLVASRLLQGAGAALVAPSALSLITTGFAEGARRNRALGMYGATASIGFVAGQVLGGVLVEFTSWRAVFLVNVPVGLFAAIMAPRLLGESRAKRPRGRLDAAGALLITVAVAAAVFAVSQVDVLGWTSPAVLAAIALGVLAAVAVPVVERHSPDPLVRPDLLRMASLRKASTLNLLLGVWNAGELIVLSLYFQQVLHDSPLVTGLAIAPQGIVGFTAGAFGARLTGRVGIRRVLVLTSATATLGFLVLSRLPASGGYSPLLAAVMLVGFGSAGTAFGTMVTASHGVADGDQGLVGGVINTSRQIGAAMGAALLPAVADAVDHGNRAAAGGDRAAMLAGAVAAALALAVALGSATKARPRLRHL